MAQFSIYNFFQPYQREPCKAKKIFSIILAVAVTLSFMPMFVRAENNEVNVYITVSDITDYTDPLNVLVERQRISVSNFNLADFGDTMNGIECIEGITYLHALVQLHRNLYGDEKVAENLLLTTDGVTKIFMGKSVANVMYKNGRDIFALPQLVNIKDGDEIQVCLYDEGHSQAIATFNEAKLDNISPHETLTLTLQQHYGYPRNRDAIPNVEITTNTGEYITDENGNIVTTDDNGNFNVSFSNEGTYTISAMPIINYYMSDTGGGIKVEWIPQTTIKEVEYTYQEKATQPPFAEANGDYDGSSGGISSAEAKALLEVVETDYIVLFEWECEDDDDLLGIACWDLPMLTKTETRLEEVTELVKVETVVPDELEPMVTYTTPFVTINVTTDLIIEDIYMIGNNLNVITKNSEYHSEDDLYIAGYSVDENGLEMLKEVKTYKTIDEHHRVSFESKYDIYKVFAWVDGTMSPLMNTFIYKPSEGVIEVLDYDYTQPLPQNTYITTKG